MEETKNENTKQEIETTEKQTFISRFKPKNITKFIIYLILFILSMTGLLLLIYCRAIWGDEVGNKILGEGVKDGWVALGNVLAKRSTAFIYSLITIAIAVFAIAISNFLVKITTLKGKKAKTVGSLVYSLIKYIIIILAIAFILGAWGVDVASIVAGLGVLTLVIGLGCQSLIQDIVSGLFIVFDDYFDVGDMIIVDGFRGYVESIGLRTVKLNDKCGNIKSITNSAITTCVNLSRSPNLIYINFHISYNEDLERVEGIMAKEMEYINKNLPQLTDPLVYKGIDGYDDAGVMLAFGATCKAEYRFQVGRDLRREIYLALKRNDIQIPYNQITVNTPLPKERPLANKEEKKRSKQINDLNRKLEEEDKNTFIEKARKNLHHFENGEKKKTKK